MLAPTGIDASSEWADIIHTPQRTETPVRFLSAEENHPNFPWKIVIHTERDGVKTGYALMIDARGMISGNSFTYVSWTDTIGAVYQLHENDIEVLEKEWVLRHFADQLEKKEWERIDSIKQQLMRLFIDGERFDPFWGRYPDGLDLKEFRANIWGLPEEVQKRIANYFYAQTIGEHIANNRKAYMVYGLLKGTAFGNEFSRLENARLIEAGYGPFIL